MCDYDLKKACDESYLCDMKNNSNLDPLAISKKILHDGSPIAIIMKKKKGQNVGEGINFITDSNNELQTCILNHPKGHKIAGHIHNYVERKISRTQEVLYIEKGKMRVDFLNENGEKIAEEILEQGDLITLIDKGHGMEMLEDTIAVYVKQGPYISKEVDKKVFEEK